MVPLLGLVRVFGACVVWVERGGQGGAFLEVAFVLTVDVGRLEELGRSGLGDLGCEAVSLVDQVLGPAPGVAVAALFVGVRLLRGFGVGVESPRLELRAGQLFGVYSRLGQRGRGVQLGPGVARAAVVGAGALVREERSVGRVDVCLRVGQLRDAGSAEATRQGRSFSRSCRSRSSRL